MSYLENEVLKLTTDWKDIILNSNLLPEKNFLNNVINNSETYYPNSEHVFRCFSYFNIEETKVVILGQDPYHIRRTSNGIMFWYQQYKKDTTITKKYRKRLNNDMGHGLSDYTLEKWAKQGVLLLNTSLTVKENKPNSHKKIWIKFTNDIINYINQRCKNIIFVTWGAYRYNMLEGIDKDKHKLIISSHPSPLSYYKKLKEYTSFEGSKPFSKINSILSDKNRILDIILIYFQNVAKTFNIGVSS